jgi:peptidoglycan/xylan/chitin deacetylase (PgdA/CDA1 family)
VIGSLRRVLRAAPVRIPSTHVGRRLNRRRLLICCYHGIAGPHETHESWLLLPQRIFELHIEHLATHYRCVPLEQGIEECMAGDLRQPTACITFDDGYRNNLTHAYPILRKWNVPATVYVSTTFIGSDTPLWTTRLRLAFEQTANREVNLEAFGLGTVRTSSASISRTANQVCEALKAQPPDVRRDQLDVVEAQLARPKIPEAYRFMTWPEVSELAADGLVSIGAHTLNHEIVRHLSDESLSAEIQGSIDMVAAHIRQPARTFAFPNGRRQDYDERSVRLLKRAGIVGAVTTIPGLNPSSVDRYELRRVVVGGGEPFADFQLQASGILR